MPNQTSERFFLGFIILYVVVWITFESFSSYTQSSFPQATYGAKIEGNHYFLRIDKTQDKYQEVTRQQFEEEDRAKTNFAIIGCGGMLGLFAFALIADKLKITKIEKKGWMRHL